MNAVIIAACLPVFQRESLITFHKTVTWRRSERSVAYKRVTIYRPSSGSKHNIVLCHWV